MSLSPAEKARLAFDLTIARHLAAECCAGENFSQQPLVEAARGVLQSSASGANLQVASADDLVDCLQRAADQLKTLASSVPDSHHGVSNVVAAERCLRSLADGVDRGGTGDGTAIGGAAGYRPCSCGLLELAAILERRVRAQLEASVSKSLDASCQIHYVTTLISDAKIVAPFRVDGETSILRAPRTVTIVLKPDGMDSRDLWHITYTLCHELLCHAFQGAFAHGKLPNAHQKCHWTEGWMDTLAFDWARELVDDQGMPQSWLPLRGDDARGELSRFHERRYKEPRGLDEDETLRRRRAREAYRRLA